MVDLTHGPLLSLPRPNSLLNFLEVTSTLLKDFCLIPLFCPGDHGDPDEEYEGHHLELGMARGEG